MVLGMQALASLQSVRSAFVMGPKERAVYLRRPVPRGRQVVEQSGEEEAATVAGTNAAALRAWLRQVGQPHHPIAFMLALEYMMYPGVLRHLSPVHIADVHIVRPACVTYLVFLIDFTNASRMRSLIPQPLHLAGT